MTEPAVPAASSAAAGGHDPDATAAMLAARYGRRPPLGRGPRVVLVVLGLAAMVAATVAVYRWSQTPSSAFVPTTTGYRVESPSRVHVTFQVTKPAGRPGSCLVQAQDTTSTVVGETTVSLPAAPSQASFSVTVVTTATATTASVTRCTAG